MTLGNGNVENLFFTSSLTQLNLTKDLTEKEKSITFNSWQGVCPKLFIIPSKAFLSFSSVRASKSTAPGLQPERRADEKE